MRILIDECVPRQIKNILPGHDCVTVQEMEWGGFENGDLLERAEEQFDIFITADKNLAYQQNLDARKIAIVELSTNDLRRILNSARGILERIAHCNQGEYMRIEIV
ncbi:MAG: DUF5615 family PIN-like protein [Ignavibacteriales bacterium]|nr:DUF5615 family PIN-like protein [Ignavibacteriales bacterium]